VGRGERFSRRGHFILNLFRIRVTAAIFEVINNKIKRLKRIANGSKMVDYVLIRIRRHCGLLSPRLSTLNMKEPKIMKAVFWAEIVCYAVHAVKL
jgi:hypothetical protein